MSLLKIYSYVVRDDRGLAPNPFWNYCTLALDQPLIRQVAQVGDWIVGLKETSEKLEDHSMIFAMQVTEKITYDEYWSNPRFVGKIPDFSVKDHIQMLGDNIYDPAESGFEQVYSLRSKDFFENEEDWLKQKKEDLQGKYVLISDRTFYFYFGREPVNLPSIELLNLLYCDIGHKCIADPEVPQEFLDFIDDLKKQKKFGFISPPEIWPKEDDSYIQCMIDDEEKI